MSHHPDVPGLSLLTEWITPDDERALLADVDAAPWREDLQRRVQHYGWRYDYKARRVDASMRLGALPSWASRLAERMVDEGRVAHAPDQVIVNEYAPGQGIARHVDCVPCFGPVVLSLTLASGCVMELQGPDGAKAPIALLPRSLLVLADDARLRWSHAIAGRKSDVVGGVKVARGRRVSLTFRTVRVG